jgi:N-acyl-D-amino-acid deacylase
VADLVVRGGLVVDGTGAEGRVADVAIEGGRIVEVGSNLGKGRREIDARGALVTPGFVDVHTHYDAQASWDPYLTPSTWHGCTTVVMGNCGVGFAPAARDRHEWLIELMEGVEDIPGSAMVEGIHWEWESFPEYMSALEAKPHAIDFGLQMPHGALRAYVMGERGARNEPATADDIAEMSRLVEEALQSGALGFSTSRTSLHKSKSGELVPGTNAERDELFGIGRALARQGRGVFQLALEHGDVLQEIMWMRELARETKRPVSFNLSQVDQAPQLWRKVVGELDRAHEEKIPLYAQVAGRSIGIVMCWEGTAHPFATYPSMLGMRDFAPDARLAMLRTPGFMEKLIAETPIDLGPFAKMVTTTFAKMFPLKSGVDYEPEAAASIAQIAEREGRHPLAIAFEALIANDGRGMIYFPLFNYAEGSLSILHELHQHPQTRLGLSDAGAHCGAICDGGMPTFMLAFWTRDRTRGPKLSIPAIVHRQTRQTALLYGLEDRGVIAPGFKADLNVIDYERLGFDAPEMAYDLPAQGRRLVQRARGYLATVCSGEVIVERDAFTGTLPGKLIRGAQTR